MRLSSLVGWLALQFVLGGCSSNNQADEPPSDGPTEMEALQTLPGPDALPEFAVADVNPSSPRYNSDVSPRDYLGQISAWYFGHAT